MTILELTENHLLLPPESGDYFETGSLALAGLKCDDLKVLTLLPPIFTTSPPPSVTFSKLCFPDILLCTLVFFLYVAENAASP